MKKTYIPYYENTVTFDYNAPEKYRCIRILILTRTWKASFNLVENIIYENFMSNPRSKDLNLIIGFQKLLQFFETYLRKKKRARYNDVKKLL